MLHYSKKRFFRKGFDPEIYFVAYGNLTRLGFSSSRTQKNTKGFLPLIVNMLSVSIIVFAGKGGLYEFLMLCNIRA